VAKKIKAVVKLQIAAGKATPAPPVGPALGQHGINIMAFCKDYNERTKKFVDSGKVDEAANDAKPDSEQEAHEMQKAERLGKQRAKGEDPALKKPNK